MINKNVEDVKKSEEVKETKILKKCTRCKKDKELKMFHKNKMMYDGYNIHCKLCRSETRKKKRLEKYKRIKNITQSHQTDIMNLPIMDFEKEILEMDPVNYSHTAIVCAQSRSGKSYLYRYIISKIRHLYDVIIVITKSPTSPFFDDKYEKLFDYVTTGKNGTYKNIIDLVALFQRKTKALLKIYFVIEDFYNPRCKKIEYLYCIGRNSGISTAHLIQKNTFASRACRENTNFIFCLHQKSVKSVRGTVDEFLLDFVDTPDEVRTQKDKEKFLIKWVQKQTENYWCVCLNIINGKIMKIKAT
jgi:hypothetical protein